jgi:hypothetical protein
MFEAVRSSVVGRGRAIYPPPPRLYCNDSGGFQLPHHHCAADNSNHSSERSPNFASYHSLWLGIFAEGAKEEGEGKEERLSDGDGLCQSVGAVGRGKHTLR